MQLHTHSTNKNNNWSLREILGSPDRQHSVAGGCLEGDLKCATAPATVQLKVKL